MEYGLISSTTLTALGDAIREKSIIPATREETVLVDHLSYHSDNTTSETDPTPLYLSTSMSIDIDAIPEAHSVEFVFTVGTVTTFAPDFILGSIDILKDGYKPASISVSGSSAEQPISSKIDPYYRGGPFKVSLWMPYNDDNCFGVVFDVYALDADGNRMQFTKTQEVTNTVSPTEMVEAINNFEMPKAPPEEACVFSGDLRYAFANGTWDWFLEAYGDRLSSKNITSLASTFSGTKVKRIPFTLNIQDGSGGHYSTFSSASYLEECPKIRGNLPRTTSLDLSGAIDRCFCLACADDLLTEEMLDGLPNIKVTSSYSVPRLPALQNCYSLRRIPHWFYKWRLCEDSTAFPNYSYTCYYNAFSSALALDEITNLPVWKCQAAQTSNMFSGTFSKVSRAKAITFETNSGQPIVVSWKSQVIDLINHVGHIANQTDITNFNSGITADKLVTDDATYQALKNDPDWFTTKVDYSRYNHDSAVETINSLPDTSAYLASAGGTNTIKFKKVAGSKTDGGAIETLTEEEIAVAAAKGWTVTLST